MGPRGVENTMPSSSEEIREIRDKTEVACLVSG